MDFIELNSRYTAAKSYKNRWLALYKELYYYVLPDRDAFNVKWNFDDQGKPTTIQAWDTTAIQAAKQRANDLHGLLIPKDRIWGKLVMDPHLYDQESINANQKYLDEINDHIFFYINESNLSRVVSSSNLDLVGGTGAIWVESIDDMTPLYFRSIPSVALCIEYSSDDVLNTCWYQCKMSGRKIRDSFPDYKGVGLEKLLASPNELYIVVYGQIKLSEDKFFIYMFLEDDPFTPLMERERGYNQIIIYRDQVRPGESEGRGVGLDMLPTIRDLNKVVEYHRKSLALKAYPPLFYENNKFFNPYSIRQWAGALIAKQPGSNNPIEALQMPNAPEVLADIQSLQNDIRTAFQVDPLGEINLPVRSATEISIRENRAQRTSATDISRLINELPKQIFEVSAKILSERKLLTSKRDAKLNFNTKKFRFDYKSPLYDLQKQDDLNHFVTSLQIKQQFFGAGSAVATVDLVQANKFLANCLNLPANLSVSDDKLQSIIDAMGQAANQQALPASSTAAAQVNIPQPSQIL